MSKITLTGTIGHFNSQSMSLKIIANDQTVYQFDQLSDKNFTAEFDITLPGAIKFIVDNKGEFDTSIDSQGNIIDDKFVRIDQMTIDRMPLKPYLLQN